MSNTLTLTTAAAELGLSVQQFANLWGVSASPDTVENIRLNTGEVRARYLDALQPAALRQAFRKDAAGKSANDPVYALARELMTTRAEIAREIGAGRIAAPAGTAPTDAEIADAWTAYRLHVIGTADAEAKRQFSDRLAGRL